MVQQNYLDESLHSVKMLPMKCSWPVLYNSVRMFDPSLLAPIPFRKSRSTSWLSDNPSLWRKMATVSQAFWNRSFEDKFAGFRLLWSTDVT